MDNKRRWKLYRRIHFLSIVVALGSLIGLLVSLASAGMVITQANWNWGLVAFLFALWSAVWPLYGKSWVGLKKP